MIHKLAEKKCQLHEQSQEKSYIFYIIDGKEIILDTQYLMFLNFVLKKGNSYYLNTVLCYFLGAGAGKSKKDRLRQLFKVHEESPCKVNATGTGISTRILAEVALLPRL